MKFSDLLKKQRAALGCSQSTVPVIIPGLPLKTYQGWECGRMEPPKWAQELILHAMGEETARK